MKRALVVLGHSQHAGMLRAAKLLADAAPRHGWQLGFGETHRGASCRMCNHGV